MAVKLLITDFDGTLVDTFEANYRAYAEAFDAVGRGLTRERYRECFGFRFDRFMDAMGVEEDAVRAEIRKIKGECYPSYFSHLVVNRPLLEMLRAFHRSGGKTAIASTARGVNLRNALRHIGAADDFDLVLAGESVHKGKPDPEIYLTVLERLGVGADEALVFEDSAVGFAAASSAGIQYIPVTREFYTDI